MIAQGLSESDLGIVDARLQGLKQVVSGGHLIVEHHQTLGVSLDRSLCRQESCPQSAGNMFIVRTSISFTSIFATGFVSSSVTTIF